MIVMFEWGDQGLYLLFLLFFGGGVSGALYPLIFFIILFVSYCHKLIGIGVFPGNGHFYSFFIHLAPHLSISFILQLFTWPSYTVIGLSQKYIGGLCP